MPTDRFSLRHGASLPAAEALNPYELGFCEENGALYIGGEGDATRLTFPEPSKEFSGGAFTFSEPVSHESAPTLSIFADTDGRLCFKNSLGEITVISGEALSPS